MQGAVGDTVTVHSRRVGAADRVGTILEVRGPEGPFLVQFGDRQPCWLFPGPDTVITPGDE